jgi:hypothetical protein
MPPRHEDTKPHQASGQIRLTSYVSLRALVSWWRKKMFFSSLLEVIEEVI